MKLLSVLMEMLLALLCCPEYGWGGAVCVDVKRRLQND